MAYVARLQEKLSLYAAMDFAINNAIAGGHVLTSTEIRDSASALVTSYSLNRHAEMYSLAGNDLRKYLREEGADPNLPRNSRSVRLELSSALKMVIDKLTLYRAMDDGIEFSMVFEMKRRDNSVFAISLLHHAKIYALANAELRAFIREKTNL
ncbi:hypothetical protein A2U01_0041629, partial [Trifolium medium]|nr:hypothetical protein [Trifolium medium]